MFQKCQGIAPCIPHMTSCARPVKLHTEFVSLTLAGAVGSAIDACWWHIRLCKASAACHKIAVITAKAPSRSRWTAEGQGLLAKGCMRAIALLLFVRQVLRLAGALPWRGWWLTVVSPV